MPPVIPKITLVLRLAAGLRFTVKFTFVEPLSPSATVTARGVAIVNVGVPVVSSSRMVPVPLLAVADSPAPVALLRAITTVSSASRVVSPVTNTVIVWLVVPAANVSIPAVTAV